MITRISLFVLIISILFAGGGVPPQLDPYNPPFEPGVVLVKLKDDVQVHRDQLARSANPSFGISTLDMLNLEFELSSAKKVFTQAEQRSVTKTVQMPQGFIEVPNLHNIYRLSFDEDISVEMMVQAYSEDPNVEYAEPDYLMRMMETTPDDPMYPQQWHHAAVNAPALWDSTTGDTSQVIGIIDTGVDWDHPDLAENIWINWVEYHGAQGVDDDGNGYVDDIRGWDWISDDNDPNDDNSHGTHVAGIAAATGNNGIGVTGVSWNSKIMCLKVLQSTGYGNSSDVAAAVEYAGNNGAAVMNLSLGSYGHSQVLENALAVAYNTTVEVAAAGNSGLCIGPGLCPDRRNGAPMYPGAFSWVLGVRAGDAMGPQGFSNYDQDGPQGSGYIDGYNYEIKAPGVGINSTFPNGGYHALNGTSMASPVIAGGIANILAYEEPVSTELFRAKLINNTGTHVDLYETLIAPEPDPVLSYVSHTIVDTCETCDNDGRADAGETIEIWFTVKNYGGYADSVTVSIDFAEFEDRTTATIIDTIGYIGDISAYGQLTNELDPLKLNISQAVSNNRQIRFLVSQMVDSQTNSIKEFAQVIQSGTEWSAGYYSGTSIFNANQINIVTGNVVFDSLIIKPGTQILIDPERSLSINSYLEAIGRKDSLIIFDINGVGKWGWIQNNSNILFNLKHCVIQNGGNTWYGFLDGPFGLDNCIIRYIGGSGNGRVLYPSATGTVNITHSVVTDNEGRIHNWRDSLCYNIIVNNVPTYVSDPSFIWLDSGNSTVENNIFVGNRTPSGQLYHISPSTSAQQVNFLSANYYGHSDANEIENQIYDFFEDLYYPILIGSDSATAIPSSQCHGFPWKIELDTISLNKYDTPYSSPSGLGIIGPDTYQFDVYFNRPMDIEYAPFLTFGVVQPYTQHVVNDSASWSADSSVWTAYTTMGIETGDGINRVRVSGARDTENFEIPIEDQRFEFVLQAAGAASVQFIATPGIGKVDLEWPPASTDDALGYNMYRSLRLNDSTWATYEMINDILITDSTYIDFAVIPDSTYKYQYTVLGTDFAESDPSKTVPATPFSAANGDANGDLSVNVLDIISMVSYVLEGDPQPFLFDAADLNGDDQVNVLDIIGVINIILGGTPKTTQAPLAEAGVSFDEGELWVSSQTPVAGMQFTFSNATDDVRLSSSYPVEIGSRTEDGELTVVLYSLKGEVVPSGAHEVLTISNGENLQLESMLLSTSQGHEIPSRQGSPEEVVLPEEYVLKQNYPNPFNASTTIEYAVPKSTDIQMTIYNIRGQEVFSRHQASVTPGWYSFTWNGNDLRGKSMASGLYLYRFETEGFVETHKMLLLK